MLRCQKTGINIAADMANIFRTLLGTNPHRANKDGSAAGETPPSDTARFRANAPFSGVKVVAIGSQPKLVPIEKLTPRSVGERRHCELLAVRVTANRQRKRWEAVVAAQKPGYIL